MPERIAPAKLVIIFNREYLQRVRSKGFIIFTLLLPALMAGYVLLIIALGRSGERSHYRLAVVDMSGRIYASLVRELAHDQVHGQPQFQLTPLAAAPASLPAVKKKLDQAVLARRFNGYLLLPANILQRERASYHAGNVTDFFLLNKLQGALRAAVSRERLAAAGVSARVARRAMQPLKLRQLKITRAGERADQGQTFALAYVLGFLLYMMLVLYGVGVMRGVVEEKTTRTAEVVLSAVDTFTLMLGKILGLGAAGLTQFSIWLLCLALVAGYGALSARMAGLPSFLHHLPHLPASTYLDLLIYFVLGFLLYAALYAAVGAMVSSEQDAQQAQLPITLLLVGSFILMQWVLAHPSGTRAAILSEVPFFTPILMTLRLTVAPPPAWQLGLSWLLMAVTGYVLIRLAAKVYRTGILMTGKRPSLPELLRWLRAA